MLGRMIEDEKGGLRGSFDGSFSARSTPTRPKPPPGKVTPQSARTPTKPPIANMVRDSKPAPHRQNWRFAKPAVDMPTSRRPRGAGKLAALAQFIPKNASAK